jgi:hypothetical protein
MAPCDLSRKVVASVEEGLDESDLCSFDQDIFAIKTSMFKRQLSAPGRLSKGSLTRQISAPMHRLLICEETAQDSSEPEREDDLDGDDLNSDLDPAQPTSGPARQISIMSDLSAKAPSRQVTSMSTVSAQDWEPISAANLKRQETDEQWPTWKGKDPLVDKEQLGPNSQSIDQSSDHCANSWMPLMMSPDDINVQAMSAMLPQFYTWQIFPQTNQPDNSDQPPFRRKRESLIDLAKQQQEKKEERKEVDASVKFCPWCGGSFNPSFKFCVFCGNEFSTRKSNA